MDLGEALWYVEETGYVPWGSYSEREATELMQADSLIEFVIPHGKIARRRSHGSGRYFLSRKGMRTLNEWRLKRN